MQKVVTVPNISSPPVYDDSCYRTGYRSKYNEIRDMLKGSGYPRVIRIKTLASLSPENKKRRNLKEKKPIEIEIKKDKNLNIRSSSLVIDTNTRDRDVKVNLNSRPN